MKKNQVQIINWILTRKCNLNCSYCGIVKDSDVYKSIKSYKNDMDILYLTKCLKKIKEYNDKCFHIFYGGEPFLYKYITELIEFCNNENIYYTVITNNSKEIQPKILQTIEKVKKIQGISASVDPVLFMEHLNTTDRYKKSKEGFENLIKLKKYSDDVVAEITVDNDNFIYLEKLVKELTYYNIWSSITFIDLKKNEYYDFSNITNKMLVPFPTIYVYKYLQDLINKNYLIHMGEELLDRIYNILPTNLDCELENYCHNVTVDADGTIRLCLRIKGIETPKFKILNFIENFDEIHNAMITDKKNLCVGCNWTCPIMSKLAVEENMTNDIIHK